MTDTEWKTAQAWLISAVNAAYRQERGSKKHLRTFHPPEWAKQATDALGRDDIEAFKHIRLAVTLGETCYGSVLT